MPVMHQYLPAVRTAEQCIVRIAAVARPDSPHSCDRRSLRKQSTVDDRRVGIMDVIHGNLTLVPDLPVGQVTLNVVLLQHHMGFVPPAM